MIENQKFRHEFKYQCSEAQLKILEKRLEKILPIDSNAKKGFYSIRSMYFDNYCNKCFYENERGVDPREKFRIRIYNASCDRISLECKRKENGKTNKTSCLISKTQFNNIIQGMNIEDLKNYNPLLRKFFILIKTQLYRPVVIVEYDRVPYVYKYGNVRITFDRNIRSSSEFDRFFCTQIATRPVLQSGQHLLEVKYDDFLPSFIKEILQIGDLQRTTFSKYYLCRKFSDGRLL